jgi:hypothetical protein
VRTPTRGQRRAARLRQVRAQRDTLYWFYMMLNAGGPDGSDLDFAVCEDAAGTAREVTVELGGIGEVVRDG